jgi:hypothetical protein
MNLQETSTKRDWKMILLRSAGVGGGFAVVIALLLGGIAWWLNRPKEWSDKAITAKPTELATRQLDEELRLEFHYALTNHSSAEYTLPSNDMGALMRHVPNGSSVEKLDEAAWDNTIRIPPHQTVGVTFTVPYRLSEFNMSSVQLDSGNNLYEFLGRRLHDINGLTFFDYSAKYRIEMPNVVNALTKEPRKTEPQPPKPATPTSPPDMGDIFDKVAACQQADSLLDRCQKAHVSFDSSPWVKYGGWPDKLQKLPTPPAGYTLDPSPETCAIAAEWRNYCKAKVK